MSTESPTETSNVFEFEFIPPKIPTKVESIFDFVNGDGTQHKSQSVSPSLPIEPDGIMYGDAPPWFTPPSSEPEARLQAAESSLEVATVLDEINQPAPETTADLVLTESQVLDGYSPSDNEIIKVPVYFEFEHANSIDPVDETVSADDAIAEAEAEAEYQRLLERWEVESKNSELRWKKKQRDTEQEQVQIALNIQEITDNLKAARQLHKLAIKTLQDLKTSGPDYPRRPAKPTPKKATKTTVAKDGTTTTTTTTVVADKPDPKKPNEDQSWRQIKSETFLTLKIEGMGAKKLDALLHEFPTLGDLIDAKVEASKKCKHFSTQLPKGIGENLADRIDNAVDDVFAKHCQG